MTEAPSAENGALIHISKVAERLGLSEFQVRGMVTRGELPSVKIPDNPKGRTYVHADAIARWLDGLAS